MLSCYENHLLIPYSEISNLIFSIMVLPQFFLGLEEAKLILIWEAVSVKHWKTYPRQHSHTNPQTLALPGESNKNHRCPPPLLP